MHCKITKLPKFEDERGFLIEFLKNRELDVEQEKFGQIYLATIKKGHVRGNHYHLKKREVFTLMAGKARVILEDINSKERREVILDPTEDKVIKVEFGPGIAHAIESLGDQDAVIVSYNDIQYDENKTDDIRYVLK